MYKQAIIKSLIKCAVGPPDNTDILAAINLSNNLGDAMSTPRVKGMPFNTEMDASRYRVNMTDKHITGGAPAFSVNQADPAAVSLLLGTAANDYNRKLHPWDNLLNRGWTWGTLSNTADLINNISSTNTSWKAIEKAYKDHPDVINDFNYLRGRLTNARMASDLANTLPGLLGGSYLGYKWFKGKTNPFSKKKHPILHYLTKGVKGMAGFALGSMLATGAAHLLSIPQYYKHRLDQTVQDPSYVYRSRRLNENLKRIGRV